MPEPSSFEPQAPVVAPASSAHTLLVQRLFVKHHGVIKAYVLSLLPNLADAEDVLQETFLVVTAKAATFTEGTNFVAWACTVARFKVLEARRRFVQSCGLSEEAIEALTEETPDAGFFEDRVGAVRQCLDRLAPRARQIVWLRYHGGCSCDDIGRQVGWRATAVRVALAKARNALRTCVETQLKRVA
jgi:RNA polymerase sigma-70 factor, ECF subfamily